MELAALASDGPGMEQFLDLDEGFLSRRLRGAPEPGGGAGPPPVALVSLAELWEKAAVSGLEVETYNLDRRQFVLDLLETTAAVFRQAGAGAAATPNRP